MIQVARVVVGQVASSFDRCERTDATENIDVEAARAQHAEYVAALAACGLAIDVVVADDRHPDCVFVEDAAVVLDDSTAVITRPGAASRRGEVEAVSARLPQGMDVHSISAPATIDGGDVLRTQSQLFVGLSSRTNAEGARALADVAATRGLACSMIRVPRGLHLKSACTLADATTLLYDPEAQLDPTPFASAGLTLVPVPEAAGANTLALGGRRVLVSSAAPSTAALLQERGFDVMVLDVSELHKADGALTCCSIRIPASGAWCT